VASYGIRDPVYGFVRFSELEKHVIAQPAFQRLRRIHQLGFSYLVYPGACHTRFEHSVGVMHLASLMFEAITARDENKILLKAELNYDDHSLARDKDLIRLAGLLHDVGHAPFSHVSEAIMPLNPSTNEGFKHEDYSESIIMGSLKSAIENTDKNKLGIKAEEVVAFLKGNVEILGRRVFWRVLLSSQLDADRADYLLRDSLHVGVKHGLYDCERLLDTLTLANFPEEDHQLILCVEKGGWHVAEALVICRYLMFTQVYFHKTTRAYQRHLERALATLLPDGKLPKPTQKATYLRTDDYSTWRDIIAHAKRNPDCRAIVCRNHYREVYCTAEKASNAEKDILEALKKKLLENQVDFFEDTSERLWYELNTATKPSQEIFVFDGKKSPKPLSELSSLAPVIGEINQTRLYVPENDRRKAEEIKKCTI